MFRPRVVNWLASTLLAKQGNQCVLQLFGGQSPSQAMWCGIRPRAGFSNINDGVAYIGLADAIDHIRTGSFWDALDEPSRDTRPTQSARYVVRFGIAPNLRHVIFCLSDDHALVG